MEDTGAELVISPPNAAVGLAPSTSRTGDSSFMIAWISRLGRIISSTGIGMLLSNLKENEASTCSLSRAVTHP